MQGKSNTQKVMDHGNVKSMSLQMNYITTTKTTVIETSSINTTLKMDFPNTIHQCINQLHVDYQDRNYHTNANQKQFFGKKSFL